VIKCAISGYYVQFWALFSENNGDDSHINT